MRQPEMTAHGRITAVSPARTRRSYVAVTLTLALLGTAAHGCATRASGTPSAAPVTPEAPPADSWDPEPAAALVRRLLDIWPARAEAEDVEELLYTTHFGGLRGVYNTLARDMNLRLLGEVMDTPVFLSDSPHGVHPDVESQAALGRYNPRFLTRTLRVLDHLEHTGAITDAHRDSVQDSIVPLVRALLAAHDAIDAHGGLAPLYQLWLEAGAHFPYRDYATQRAWFDSPYARLEDELREATLTSLQQLSSADDIDPIVDYAAGFWVRRAHDGTSDLMRQVLQRALRLLTPPLPLPARDGQ